MPKKLLLIYPTLITEAPITLGMLSAVAKNMGWETKAVVNTFKEPLKIEDFVREAEDCDLVGISIITFEVLFVYEIIKALKKRGKIVIVGGAHATDKSEECIKSGADIVIVGEGESVLEDVLKEYPNIKKGIRERKPFINLSKLLWR